MKNKIQYSEYYIIFLKRIARKEDKTKLLKRIMQGKRKDPKRKHS